MTDQNEVPQEVVQDVDVAVEVQPDPVAEEPIDVEVHEVADEVEQPAEETPESRRPIWPWILGILGLIIIGLLIANLIRGSDKASLTDNKNDGATQPISWKDAVEYPIGGSGPVDPASVLEGDQTSVDHTERLIVSNPDLDVRACFTGLDDDSWRAVVAWADKWGNDSPTRIEWQTNESRCSWVFPGNITDQIGQSDYEDLLKIMADAGYHDTWFVAGPEGGEFGRKTYSEIIAVSPLFNRVHVYGPALSAMPTK